MRKKIYYALMICSVLAAFSPIVQALDQAETKVLVDDCYRALLMHESEGGETGEYLVRMNAILNMIEEARIALEKGDAGTYERLISQSGEELRLVISEVEDSTVQTIMANAVNYRNVLVTRVALLALTLLAGAYLLVNPPSAIIGSDWYGELDEG